MQSWRIRPCFFTTANILREIVVEYFIFFSCFFSLMNIIASKLGNIFGGGRRRLIEEDLLICPGPGMIHLGVNFLIHLLNHFVLTNPSASALMRSLGLLIFCSFSKTTIQLGVVYCLHIYRGIFLEILDVDIMKKYFSLL